MNQLRVQAFKLRVAGRSYNEITAALGVPKSTLSGWFRHLVLSDAAVARLKGRTLQGTTNAFLKRNKMQTYHAEVRARANQLKGKEQIPYLGKEDLKIIGATLYWAEGYKRLKIQNGKERMGHTISFVNADGAMIRVFVRFLLEILDVSPESIRLSMRLYPHINEDQAQKYWADCVSCSGPKFYKTTYLISGASKGIRPFNRLPWGTLQVEVNDTQKFHQLLGLIQGVKTAL